jgi:transglutaminase-like putative cysteine protease
MGALVMSWRAALVALACLVSNVVAAAETPRPATGPAPAWTEAVVPDLATKAPPEQVSEGVQYLLLDEQVRVDANDKTRFRHLASRALNERGLDDVANIEIPFDPSYQKLTLHLINVRRGGQLIAKLPTAQIKVLQRESGLESLIYDGTRTAHVFLDDIRVGDVVEYAYSVRGTNPVFGNRLFGGFELQYGVPVARLRTRLWWPTARPVHWTRHNGAEAPQTSSSGEHTLYTWDLHDVPARVTESDAPSWFDPYPGVQWSEFADWGAVSAWALPLYQLPAAPGAKVQAAISQIAAAHATPQERLLAALTYVQSQVRYLGIEVGPGSHAPNPPETVLQRRYGDCKDKTLLTVALLRGLGVQADPALVSTSSRHAIEQHQPSPGSFNHVLVRARIGNRTYWLDPTRSPQKGDLERLVQADYGRALVVAADSRALVPMAGPSARTQRREIHATLDASSGVGQPARYIVTTTARGASADSLRATLQEESREKLQKQYLNFYTAYFGSMESTAPYTVFDDATANEVSVKERYLLSQFWQRSDANHRQEGNIEVPDVGEYLRQPRSLVRNAPLALAYPVDLTQVTEVKLPQGWTIDPDTTLVQDDAFRFERREHWDARTGTLTLTDHYQSLADNVAPERVAAYAAKLEKARQSAGYVVFQNDEGPASAKASTPVASGGPHWLPAVTATLALIAWLSFARRLALWDPAPRNPFIDEPFSFGPSGIGGWLLLPAIGLPFSILRLLTGTAKTWPVFTPEAWNALTSAGGASYHPMWLPLMLFELAGNIGMVVMACLTTWLFFRRRSSLPRVFIGFVAGSAVFVLADTVLTLTIPSAAAQLTARDWGSAMQSIVSAAIWSAYFLRSERVRRTFTRRLTRPAPAAGPAAELAT